MLRQGAAEFFETPSEGVAAYSGEMLTGGTWNDGARIEQVYAPIRRASVRIRNEPAPYGKLFRVDVDIKSDADVPDVIFSFTVINLAEQPVMCWHTSRYPGGLTLSKGLQRLRIAIDPLLLHARPASSRTPIRK